jgi:hypothetical protein
MGWWMDDVKIALLLILHKYLECLCYRKITSRFLVLSRVKNIILLSL